MSKQFEDWKRRWEDRERLRNEELNRAHERRNRALQYLYRVRCALDQLPKRRALAERQP